MFPHTALLLEGKGSALGQHGNRDSVLVQVSFGNHHEVAASIRNPQLMQGLHRHRNHAKSFTRLLKLPARDGNHAIGLEMLEVLAESFDCVEAVFAQGKCAGRGGSPCVHQGHLHDVELLAGVAHKGAAIGDVDVHLGPLIEVVDVVGVTAAHDGVGYDGIDFDSGDARAAGSQGAHYIHPAAGADDGVFAVRAQHIG